MAMEGSQDRWRIVHDICPTMSTSFPFDRRTSIAVNAQTINVARDFLSWPPQESVWEDFGLTVARFSNDFLLRLETGTVGRSLSPLWSLGSGIGRMDRIRLHIGNSRPAPFRSFAVGLLRKRPDSHWRLDRALHEKTGWAFVEQKEPTRREGSPAGAASTMFGDLLAGFAQLIRGEPSEVATAKDRSRRCCGS